MVYDQRYKRAIMEQYMHMHLKQKQQQYMQAAVQAPPPRVRATLRPYCRQTHQAPKQHPKMSSWLSEGGGGHG